MYRLVVIFDEYNEEQLLAAFAAERIPEANVLLVKDELGLTVFDVAEEKE